MVYGTIGGKKKKKKRSRNDRVLVWGCGQEKDVPFASVIGELIKMWEVPVEGGPLMIIGRKQYMKKKEDKNLEMIKWVITDQVTQIN